MGGDNRTYIKMSDGLPEHRKVVAAGGDAAWLHICALAYASRNLTDGTVPEAVVPRLSDRKQPARLAGKLIEVGLWHAAGHDCKRCPQPHAGEYVIHDYLVHQRSAAKVDEIRKKRAEAGHAGGTRKAARGKQTASNLLDGCNEAAVANSTPVSEEVLRTSQTVSETDQELPPTAARRTKQTASNLLDMADTAQDLVAEWLDHCRKRPPDRVIGQTAREIKALLDEGQDARDVREGLARWHKATKHPSTLASFVNEVINASPNLSQGGTGNPRQQQTDEQFARAMERARAREATE